MWASRERRRFATKCEACPTETELKLIEYESSSSLACHRHPSQPTYTFRESNPGPRRPVDRRGNSPAHEGGLPRALLPTYKARS